MANDRTYVLSIRSHDILGMPDSEPITIRIERADGAEGGPLYGARGLLVGTAWTGTFEPVVNDPPDPVAYSELQVPLLPSSYYLVPSRYVTHFGTRRYEFQMPESDSRLVELLTAEE